MWSCVPSGGAGACPTRSNFPFFDASCASDVESFVDRVVVDRVEGSVSSVCVCRPAGGSGGGRLTVAGLKGDDIDYIRWSMMECLDPM